MEAGLRILRISLLIIPLALSGCAGLASKRDTIKMLIALGRNDKLKQQALNQETKNFKRLKNYINNDKIKKGISAKSATKKFGEPVVVLSETKGERWAYKPSDANWIGGEKIYLFFNEVGKLFEWDCVDCR